MQDPRVTDAMTDPNTAPSAAPSSLTHRPLHHRQFVVGPEPVAPDAGWRATPVAGRLVLSYSPALRVVRVREARGAVWHLLGRAVAAAPGAPAPEEALAARTAEPIERVYSRWAGRWTLIGEGELHTDASGAMGCYHRSTGDGAVWASNSPALINDLPGI